jgi:hypothetical protein
MVGVTAFGVLAGLLTLWLALRQFRAQTGELRRQTNLANAQRALELMRSLTDLGHVFVERPDLAPYFWKTEIAPPGSTLETRVRAHAAGYMNLAEAAGWQIAVEQMTREAADAWRRYFDDLCRTAPALKSLVGDRREVLAEETIWLLQGGKPPATVENLPSKAGSGADRPDWFGLFLLGGIWLLFFALLVPATLTGYLIGKY